MGSSIWPKSSYLSHPRFSHLQGVGSMETLPSILEKHQALSLIPLVITAHCPGQLPAAMQMF